MEADKFYRFRRRDYPKIRKLVGEFRCFLPPIPTKLFKQLVEYLLWRKTASAVGDERSTRIEVFLELSIGNGILLTTFWAGKDNGSGAGRKAGKEALCHRYRLQSLPCTPFWDSL